MWKRLKRKLRPPHRHDPVTLPACHGGACPGPAYVLLPKIILFLTLVLLSRPGFSLTFHQYRLSTPQLGSDTRIHPVNILGGPEQEIVVVHGLNVSIYEPVSDGTMQLLQTIALPTVAGKTHRLYYGFARLEKNKPSSLIVMINTGMIYYPLVNGRVSPRPQVLFQADLAPTSEVRNSVQYFDFALDLDNDGVDELLLPENKGFSISRRTPTGTYKRIPLPRDAYKVEKIFRFNHDVPNDPVRAPFEMASVTYRQGVSDLLFYDANGDHKLDLIYSSTGNGPGSREVERYDVFLQQDDLSFQSHPAQSIAVPYDANADATFRDINGDGKLDAVLVRSNLDIVNPLTVLKFYIGSGEDYQIFTHESDRFVTKDPIGLVQVGDFNNDGTPDFAMTFFSYQFGSMEDIVDLAFSSRIRFKLQFFLGRGKQGYARIPDTEKEITINTKIEDFKGNAPVMIVKDLDGDHLMDLVVRSARNRIDIYPTHGKFAFDARPIQSFHVPEDAAIQFQDVNADGLEDILVSSRTDHSLMIITPTNP